jgi:hypothetical protein
MVRILCSVSCVASTVTSFLWLMADELLLAAGNAALAGLMFVIACRAQTVRR